MADERKQSGDEEFANSISHGIALLMVVAAVPVLVVSAVKGGRSAEIVGVSVFSITMILLYLTSSVYHALPDNRAKRLFKVLDHSAIYLLIAGTYTPFTLGVLHGALGWTLFGLIWGLAVAGIISKAVGVLQCPRLSLMIYVVMGWMVVIAIKPLWLTLPTWGFVCLVAGGVAYTGGILFYLAVHVRYAHFVWHLFVMAGTGFHVAAVVSAVG